MLERADLKKIAGEKYDQLVEKLIDEAIKDPSGHIATALFKRADLKELAGNRLDQLLTGLTKLTVSKEHTPTTLQAVFTRPDLMELIASQNESSSTVEDLFSQIIDPQSKKKNEECELLCNWLDQVFKDLLQGGTDIDVFKTKFVNFCPQTMRGKIQTAFKKI